jgi:hypothetical protein
LLRIVVLLLGVDPWLYNLLLANEDPVTPHPYLLDA